MKYLALFAREWEKVHDGSMPETGLKVAGGTERKETSEDVKLKNLEMGLFLVADGVSSARGWFASRETARVVYDVLGETLDRAVENNIQEARRHGEDPLDRITAYVGTQMLAAVEQADHRIKALAVNPEFRGSATTLSLAKLLELPDGEGGSLQRLFFTNVGDSRIYVQRKGGSFELMTRDDSRLELAVQREEVTPEQAREIDQALDPQHLHPSLRTLARQRNLITKSVGLGKPTESLKVSYVDLQLGDRFVIVSDGVSDQLLEEEIISRLGDEEDDTRAEEALQQAAMEMSLDGRSPRSKGDDISAMVYTVQERGPDRLYLHPEAQEESRSVETLGERIRTVRERLDKAREWVSQVDARIRASDSETSQRDRLALQIERHKATEALESYRYHFQKSRLDLFDAQLPPRFELGATVHVWRNDFDPPSLDRQPWTVTAYSSQSKQYTLRGPGGQEKEIGRYDLEGVQPGPLVQKGDSVPIQIEENLMEKGFIVTTIDQGVVELTKETSKSVKRVKRPLGEVNKTVHALLYRAHSLHQKMVHAGQAYREIVKARQGLEDQAVDLAQTEARQRATDLAGEGMREIRRIQKEIAKLKQLFDEHQELERLRIRGALSRDQEKRRKQLAIWVYGNRATPGIQERIRQFKKELEAFNKKES